MTYGNGAGEGQIVDGRHLGHGRIIVRQQIGGAVGEAFVEGPDDGALNGVAHSNGPGVRARRRKQGGRGRRRCCHGHDAGRRGRERDGRGDEGAQHGSPLAGSVVLAMAVEDLSSSQACAGEACASDHPHAVAPKFQPGDTLSLTNKNTTRGSLLEEYFFFFATNGKLYSLA